MASGVLWTARSPVTGGTGTIREVSYQGPGKVFGRRHRVRPEESRRGTGSLIYNLAAQRGSCLHTLLREDLWAHLADAG